MRNDSRAAAGALIDGVLAAALALQFHLSAQALQIVDQPAPLAVEQLHVGAIVYPTE